MQIYGIYANRCAENKNHLAESDFLFSACFSHVLSTTQNKGA